MQNTTKTQIVITLIVFCLAPALATAQEPPLADLPQAQVKLQHAALFKNGLTFFVWEARVPAGEKSFAIAPLAAMSHGTYWVAYPPAVKLQALVPQETTITKIIEPTTLSELLEANVGQKVLLTVSDKQIAGTITAYPKPQAPPVADPYTAGGLSQPSGRPRHPHPGRLMLVQTAGSLIAIDPQSVSRVDFPTGATSRSLARPDKQVQLRVDLAQPAGGNTLTISYLAKGMTWAPSYMVDISDDYTAHLSAKAVIINEAADIKDARLSLVTGFPNLLFADVVSPLGLKTNLAGFLDDLTNPDRNRNQRHGRALVMQQRMLSSDFAELPLQPAYGAAQAGHVVEDLFFYPVSNVQLNKGQTGYFPLFTENVQYQHIYRWSIPDYINEDSSSRRHGRDQQPQDPEIVWHCLRLENTSSVPWTTAPAETIKDGLILGQDTMHYTPVAAQTNLRITQALAVKAAQIEHESDRQRDAARFFGDHYDLVTVDGKLSVTNFQDKPITLEITKLLSGEVQTSEPQATIEKLARGLRRVNPNNKLTWTLKLDPAQSQQATYQYQVYIRR